MGPNTTKDSSPKGPKPPASPRSDHVIDLRAKKAQASSRPTGAGQSYMDAATPRATAEAPLRPVGPRRVVGATSGPKPAKPAAVPTKASASQVGDSDVLSVPTKRRFWSAFWRFLLLLIVLGVIVVAAVYAYVTYYQS